jgi:hypothetical protein
VNCTNINNLIWYELLYIITHPTVLGMDVFIEKEKERYSMDVLGMILD